ncbi:hypothetical protein KC19_8G132400 [Ceratodon purpureus]|uniref:Uncharacterized protein n=1 Tax=Ceratodon purpureus TaxID=3225 RepID=A0A8T0H2Y9_CERPU|nr:hypothetical protein KC19_8G132400 [Ceratodon purpureus]
MDAFHQPGNELGNVIKIHGFIRSFRPTQQGLALSVDMISRFFHRSIKVLEFLKAILFYKEVDFYNMKQIFNRNLEKISQSLIGLIVQTNHYLDKITQEHYIIGITKEDGVDLKIQLNTGEEPFLEDYFLDTYNIQIKYLNLPCLMLSRSPKGIIGDPNYMPMELCTIAQKQLARNQGQYSWNAQKQMYPSTRIQQISYFLKEMNQGPRSLRKSNMVVVNKYQFADAALSKAPSFEIIDGFHKKICDAMRERVKPAVQMIMVILDDRYQSPHYNEIKYWGDCERGVPTQIVTTNLLMKLRRSWRHNIPNLCLKMNSKLGGINVQFYSWNERALRERVCKNIKYGKFIAFGADVTHPPKGTTNPSFAAVTGSLDFGCSFYGAKILVQEPFQEIISELESAVTELLLDFQAKNKNSKLPQNILFYRDGVSDFMFKTVLEQELPQIIRGANAAQPGYKPLISLIVVVKRHNTRFFLPQALRWTEKEIGVMDIKSSNIEAGTVVDLEVCDAQKFDFYILSHVPNGQGTPRPSHYYVLYDEANFTADDFQNITHYLCHIYQRTLYPVSMPAPAYYAHLVAFRARVVSAGYKAVFERKNPPAQASTSSDPAATTALNFPPIHINNRFKMFYM